jgi:hypothetical protein
LNRSEVFLYFLVGFVSLPDDSLDLVEVLPVNLRGEENSEGEVVDGQVADELEERPLLGDFFSVESKQQERQEEVANFDQPLEAERHDGRNDEENLEANGSVEAVEDRG